MKLAAAAAAVAMLAACASEQQVTLMPRGAAQAGTGKLDRINHDLTVTVGDRTYRGKSVLQTSTTTLGTRTVNTSSSVSTALLIGDKGGQIRCEYGWDAMMTAATGVCTDNENRTYDVVIRN